MKTFNSKKSGVRTSDIDSSGALDIDSAGNLTIDSASGSITVGGELTEGQTLKLGKDGATEMIFTPHGTAGLEKISLINSAGTDTDSIKIESANGSITLDVKNNIIMSGLPTGDPGSAGALYNSSGTIKISSGGA